LCDQAVLKAAEFSPLDLAVTLSSLAKFLVYDENAIKRLSAEALSKAATFNPQAIALTLASLAKFRVHDVVLVDRLCTEALSKVAEFNGQDVAVTLFSLMCLQHHDLVVYDAMREWLAHHSVDSISADSSAQLSLCNLCASLELTCPPFPHAGLNAHTRTGMSTIHKQVSDMLVSFGVAHTNHHFVEGLLLSIALVEQRVVIEVEVPGHFFRGTFQMLGNFLFERRLLQQLGWTVLSVPHHKWNGMPQVKRRQFLATLLGIDLGIDPSSAQESEVQTSSS